MDGVDGDYDIEECHGSERAEASNRSARWSAERTEEQGKTGDTFCCAGGRHHGS